MDISNKEIISRLKLIGRINKGDKINTIFMFVHQDSFFNKLARTFWSHDKRSNTKQFIENTLERIFEMLNYYNTSTKQTDKTVCSNILRDLKFAKNGIKNIIETYDSDIKFRCDLDTILETIDNKIMEFTPYTQQNDINTEINTKDNKNMDL